MKSKLLGVLVLPAVAVLLGSGAFAAKNELPEVDSDGLQLVKDSEVRIAYARPGATLAAYDKVMLLDCYVDFVKDWQKDYNLEQIGLAGRVSDKDAEEIKERLADEFRTIFAEELTKQGHPVVEEPGDDVLLLRPALINVNVVAPDVATASRSYTITDSAGSMTLYLELYDSVTSTLLARVIDPRADDRAFAQRASRVTNKSAADRILRHWADLLAQHLGTIAEQSAGN